MADTEPALIAESVRGEPMVEGRCQKCHGTGFLLIDDGFVHEYPCPDCTDGGIPCTTCGGSIWPTIGTFRRAGDDRPFCSRRCAKEAT